MVRTPEECIRLVRLSTYNATKLLPQELTPEVAQACVSAAKSGIKWLPIQARTADLWRQAIQMRPENIEHLDYKDYFEGLDDLCLSVLQADEWLALELQTDLLKRLPKTCAWMASNIEGKTNLIGRAIWRYSRHGGLQWAKTVRHHAQRHLQKQQAQETVPVDATAQGAAAGTADDADPEQHAPAEALSETVETSQPRRQRGG